MEIVKTDLAIMKSKISISICFSHISPHPNKAYNDVIFQVHQNVTSFIIDVAGIVTCLPGEGGAKDNPVIQSLDALKHLDSDLNDEISKRDLNELLEFLDKLTELCGDQGSGNAAIATRNGGVELLCSICSKIRSGWEQLLISALKALASLLHGITVIEDAFYLFCPYR